MGAKERFYILRSKIVVIALAGMLVSFLMFLTSCDGSLNITGTVYELVDAPPTTHSEVYVDQPLPDNIQLISVESANVTVTFKSWLDKGYNFNVAHTITNANGDFKTGGVADPAKNTYVVVVNYPVPRAQGVWNIWTLHPIYGDSSLRQRPQGVLAFEINKAGYIEASAEFVSPSNKKYVSPTDNGATHTILVVLVRNTSNSTH